MPSAGATKLTRSQIASAMSQAGWPKSAIPVGVAVALAESSGNPAATNHNRNGSTDYGLFQINSIHKSILASGTWSNPVDNAKMALRVYREAGNSWRPWVTFKSGSYRKFYNANLSIDGNNDDGGFWGGVADGMGDTATDAADIAGTAFNLGFIGDKAFWTRFGIGLLAVALIVTGVIIVFRQPIGKGVKLAANLTPQGRAATVATGGKL